MNSVSWTSLESERRISKFALNMLSVLPARRFLPLLAGVLLALSAILLLDARGAHAQTSPPPPNPPSVCTSPATIRLVTASTIYQDYADNPQLTNLYVQYQITNTTASTIQSVQFGITSTTYLTRAQYEDGIYDVNLAPGQSTFVYFYVKTNDVGGAGVSIPNQPMWVALWSGDDASGAALCQRTQIFSVADAGKNQSNKITVVTSQDLGNACFSMFVSGETGNADFPVFFNASPAALDSWPADLLTLQSVTATVQTTQTVRFTDTLAFNGLPDPTGNGWPYTIGYRFCVANVTRPVPPLVIRPVNYINTGSGVSQSPFDPANVTILFPLAIGFKTDNNVTGIVGDRVVYTVTVSNIGTVSQTGVLITETVPANTVFTTTGSSAWTGCSAGSPAGTTCSINVGNVLTNSVFTYTFAVVVDQNLPSSINTITNTVYGRPSTITSTDTTPLIRRATAGITKSNGLSSVLVGQALTYTIVVTSAGPSTLQNAVISDIIPSTLTGANWTAVASNATTSPASGTGDISATVTISSGGRITYTLSGAVADSATGTLTNTVKLIPPAGITLTNSITQATDADPILLNADLAITKTASPTPAVVAGNLLTYTVVAGNNGPSNIAGAIISDTFPADLQSLAWTCTASAGATCNASSGTGSLNNVAVNLTAGSQLTFTITGTIGAGATGSIANTATITVPAGAIDQVPSNNTSTVTTNISTQAEVSVVKTGPATAVPGALITYTIVVTNAGPSAATGVNVSDTAPAAIPNPSWTCSATNATCANASGNGSLNETVTLQPGGRITFSLSGVIDSAATGSLVNTASITSASDINTGNNSSTVTTQLTPEADMAINKAGPLTVTIGRPVVYTLTVQNLGQSVANNITVTDDTPAGLTFIGFGGACSGASCNIASMAVNEIATVYVSFTIPANYTGTLSITNTATVTAATTDPQLGNNISQANTSADSLADLTVSKTASSAMVTAGTQVTYTIVVTNFGPSDAYTVSVAEVDPNQVPFVPVSVTCSGNSFPCDLGGIPLGESRTITAVYDIPTNYLTPTVVNKVSVQSPTSDNIQSNNSATETVAITSSANLSITKEGPAVIVPGTNAVFTITVKNLGPSDALGVTVSDPGFNALTSANSGDCTTPFPCSLGMLTPGSTRQIIATFAVPADFTPAQVTNTASVTSTTTDPQTGNNEDSVTVPVTRVVDLDITKEAPATAIAGESLTYSLTVKNNGPSEATNVTVSDTVPANLTFVSGTAGCVVNGGLLNCTVASLMPNVSKTFTATFDIAAVARSDIGNTAAVTSTENLTETTSTVTTTLQAVTNLSITKEAPATAVAGTQLTYTLIVTNNGPSVATNVTVSDTVPSGLSYVNGSSSCTVTGGVLNCNAGTLAVGGDATFKPVFDIDKDARGEIGNTAAVTSTETPTETTSTVTTTVTAVTDLSISKVGPASAVAGGQVTYTVVVTNNGPSNATNVTITDPDPDNLTAVGNPCVAGVCGMGGLKVGESVTLTLTFDIDPFASGSVTNTASVTSTEAPTATSSSAPTPLLVEADLAISKTDGQESTYFGMPITYTIVVTNNGPSGVIEAVVSDTLPAEVTNATWSCAAVAPNTCAPVNGTGSPVNPLVKLAPNSTVTITVNGVLVTEGENWTLRNVASVQPPPGATDPITDNNTTTDTTNLSFSVDAIVTKTVTPADVVAPGQLFTYVVSIGNAGPSTAIDATVNDPLPVQMVDPQWTCVATVGSSCDTPDSGAGSIAGQQVTIQPGGLVTYTITGTATTDSEVSRSIVNTAQVTFENEMVQDTNPSNNTSTVTVTLTPNAFVVIGKTNGQTIAVPGSTLTYVITLANEGPSDAYGTLFDIYPPELSSATWQSSGANGAQVLDPVENITTPPGVTVKLPAGSVLTVTGSASVYITATGWLTNVAQFTMREDIAAINPITQAVDVDEIVPAVVTGKIFSDLNGNGVLDAGEPGLPGVRVLITPTSGGATEVTANANGEFSLVVAPGAFSINVVQSSVPAGYALTSANDAQNGVAVAGANATAPIGYQARGSVGGLSFNDINGNGVRDAGEPGLPNVIVTLAPNVEQPTSLQAAITTTTDANGNYLFTDVAAGSWTVSAAAPAGFVNTTPIQQNVIVTVNERSLADFGFQQPGAVVITKAGQTSGKSNQLGADRLITYTLVVTNTGGAVLNNVLVTDTLPSYLQYVDGSATPAPAFTLPLVWQIASLSPGQSATIRFSVKVDAGFNSVIRNIAMADSQVEPPTPSNEVVIDPAPTAITLLSFTAHRDGSVVRVEWATGVERNTYGFNVIRSETGKRADAIQVNADLILAGVKGGQYAFTDASAEAGKSYTYWLQELEVEGGRVIDYLEYPATVQPAGGQGVTRYSVFVPLIMR